MKAHLKWLSVYCGILSSYFDKTHIIEFVSSLGWIYCKYCIANIASIMGHYIDKTRDKC